MFAKDKRSSLFGLFVSNEEKGLVTIYYQGRMI